MLPPEPEFAWVLEEVLASTDLFVVDWRLDFRQIDHSPCWLVGAPDAKRERTL
ncbi:MAG: hypothetical protein Q8P41_18605 [Pseudomonadota bacterium]|nr:hypothetical protein [Pseudomonadota bacterium]